MERQAEQQRKPRRYGQRGLHGQAVGRCERRVPVHVGPHPRGQERGLQSGECWSKDAMACCGACRERPYAPHFTVLLVAARPATAASSPRMCFLALRCRTRCLWPLAAWTRRAACLISRVLALRPPSACPTRTSCGRWHGRRPAQLMAVAAAASCCTPPATTACCGCGT